MEQQKYKYEIDLDDKTVEVRADLIEFTDGMLSLISGQEIIAQFTKFNYWIRKQ